MAKTKTDYERYIAAEEYHIKALKALEQQLLATFDDFPADQRKWSSWFEELRVARVAYRKSRNANSSHASSPQEGASAPGKPAAATTGESSPRSAQW